MRRYTHASCEGGKCVGYYVSHTSTVPAHHFRGYSCDQAAQNLFIRTLLLLSVVENFALRNWQLRSLEGPLELNQRIFDLFLSAPFDILTDFKGPHGPNRKSGHGKEHPRYGRFIYALARFYEPELVVEVGTYCGGTATGWARGMVENGKGKLICIDNDTYTQGAYPRIAQKNLSKTGITNDRFELMCGDSKQIVYQLADHLREQADIYLVDGYHTYEGALADIKSGLPMLKRHGLVLVHDVDRGRRMDESTQTHPHPVYEAFTDTIKEHGFSWVILKFIRKHLGIIQVN